MFYYGEFREFLGGVSSRKLCSYLESMSMSAVFGLA